MINEKILYKKKSNSYGTTIIFSNGFKICKMSYPVSVEVKTAFGNLYRSGSIALPDFPIAFSDVPTVNYTINGNGYLYARGSNGASKTNSGSIFAVRTTSTNTLNIIVDIIAIGF